MERVSGGVPGRSGRPHHRRGAFVIPMAIFVAVLLLLGATAVTGAARAGADSLPNCTTTPETATQGCGYYISQNGSSVLAGESSESPTTVDVGTSLVQTATVMTNPGVFDVTMEASFSGPITSYSPQAGGGISVSVDGSVVTWTQPVTNGFTAFSAGQMFTLDSTVTAIGSPCTQCLSIGTLWNSGIGGNPPGDSQTPLFSEGTGGTAATASFTDTADATVPGAVDFDASASTPSPGPRSEPQCGQTILLAWCGSANVHATSCLRPGDAPITCQPLFGGSGVKTADRTLMSYSIRGQALIESRVFEMVSRTEGRRIAGKSPDVMKWGRILVPNMSMRSWGNT
jgi:hypothetical protein